MNGTFGDETFADIEPEFPGRFEERSPGMGRGMGRGFAKGGGFGRHFGQGRFLEENEKQID